MVLALGRKSWLLEHAWQDAPFIGPANVVFVYLLARDAIDPDIVTAGELQAVLMACLYVAFSYVGCEISYPLKVRSVRSLTLSLLT